MNDGETTAGEPKYEAPPNHLPMPPCEWSTDLEEFQPAPTLSMGTCKDIQEGDQVTIVAWDEERFFARVVSFLIRKGTAVG